MTDTQPLGRVVIGRFPQHTDTTEDVQNDMAVRQAAEVERKVFDAEIIDPADTANTATAGGTGVIGAGRRGLRDVVPAARIPTALARRPRTEPNTGGQFGRAVGRVVWQTGKGHVVWGQRMWAALTHAAIKEQITAARAAGDVEALALWQDRLTAAKQTRREAIHALPTTLKRALLAVLVAVLVLCGMLLLLGVGIHLAQPFGWTWGDWWDFVAGTGSVLALLFLITVHVGPFVGPVAWLAAAYRAGRHQPPPRWAAQPTPADGTEGRDVVHTADSILEALRHLGIAKLDEAFKRGWGSVGSPMQVWELPVGRDGNGVRCQIRLPQGVNVEMINKKKDLLAHNLVRLPVEVWPTEPRKKPGVLDLWIAHPGSLTGPVPEWPILAELDSYVGDYFTPIPAGVNVRGDVIRGRLFEANHAYAGIMGSGKSSLAITELLGALLDPLVEADVFVLAENADYEPMRPRLRSLVTGAGKGTVASAMACLREAYADLETRGRALKEHDQRAVTRALAERDPRLRPRVIVIDECQALFMHDEYGEEAANLVVQLISAARKYAYTLMFLTPEASSASLPRRVMAVTSCKACFAIGDQTANDAILGTGSYRAGISAVGLTPKTDEDPGDVGTAMTRGFMPKPDLMRCYFLTQDQAHQVIARALEIRERAGITPAAIGDGPVEPERDPLADIATVLADTARMKTMEVLQRLTELHRPTYQNWTARTLTAYLTDHHAAPYKTEGAMQVNTARVHEALTTRNHNGDDDTAWAEGND